MTVYSGKTTSQNPGDPKYWIVPAPNSIQTMTVFNVQWSDCPVEVEEEVQDLWHTNELRNDSCYFRWDRDAIEDEGAETEIPIRELYPLIDEFLQSRGISTCLIHWWW